VDFASEEALRFPKGLFGFEDEQEFLLMPFDQANSGLLCLQSVRTPALAFVAVDPFALHMAYAPVLQPDELEEMGVKDSQDLYYYALCAVKNPVADSTVNLKCPLAINGETRQGMQVILEQGDYHMRHRLSEFRKGDGPC